MPKPDVLTDVFISHSHADAAYADQLVRLLSECIDFLEDGIVCTSAVGYGLDFGTKFEKSLRRHIEACEVLIAVLSERSLQSQFCAFEIGAAWGQKTLIKSVLVPNLDSSLLQRPLSSLHFHRWEDASGWVQFIEEVATATGNDMRHGPPRLAYLSQQIAAYRA
ncbi:hypothetical protein B5V01_08100 [Mesorhizobium erdmanii]|uniref:TIR domain-containing protein n=2 Tax=Mesorhizobium TaxID=68287 RepID=A0A3M9X3B4_9HYPH|nr:MULTISPECIES: toll/interleukin-1 receptor domain-containing protein [Mesorhizobium]RNJ42403.1 hypothetical protein DNR46_28825 [Mesorhizobium japonicum]RXT47914.1 hypothetical protein B5V01_08100 [Mesorhizobium erdmanii]